MRKVSEKRRRFNAAVAPWRDELRSRGSCEWCSSDRHGLEIHEVKGGGTRALELDKPFSTVLLCTRCHKDLEGMKAEHAICIGLALIRYARPEDYSLDSYYRLTKREWPAEELVELWWMRILHGRTKL